MATVVFGPEFGDCGLRNKISSALVGLDLPKKGSSIEKSSNMEIYQPRYSLEESPPSPKKFRQKRTKSSLQVDIQRKKPCMNVVLKANIALFGILSVIWLVVNTANGDLMKDIWLLGQILSLIGILTINYAINWE